MFDYAAAITKGRQEYRPDPPSLTILDPWGEFLQGTDGNVTSQCGEDGVIAALFAQMGRRNCFAFEVGAHDGVFLSNTWVLSQSGWRALLIEPRHDRFTELQRNRPGDILVCERIVPTDLDRLLGWCAAPKDLDFGVIDIDGDDLRVWAGLRDFRPRVMLVEFNRAGDGILGGLGVFQAGLPALLELARTKGYRAIAETGHNAFFVAEESL